MTIDLKWALPFVMPFAVVALIRAVCWFAGVSADDCVPAAVAFLGVLFGSLGGLVIAAFMADDGIEWNIHVGGKRDE